jgi:hypothetical protein
MFANILIGALHQWKERRAAQRAAQAARAKAIAMAKGLPKPRQTAAQTLGLVGQQAAQALAVSKGFAIDAAKGVVKGAEDIAKQAGAEALAWARAARRFAVGLRTPAGKAFLAFVAMTCLSLSVGGAFLAAQAPFVAIDESQAASVGPGAGLPKAAKPAARGNGVAVLDLRDMAARSAASDGDRGEGASPREAEARWLSACMDKGACQAFEVSFREAMAWQWLHRLPDRVAADWDQKKKAELESVGGVSIWRQGDLASAVGVMCALLSLLTLVYWVVQWIEPKDETPAQRAAVWLTLGECGAKGLALFLVCFAFSAAMFAFPENEVASPICPAALAGGARTDAMLWQAKSLYLAQNEEAQSIRNDPSNIEITARQKASWGRRWVDLALGEDGVKTLDVSGLNARERAGAIAGARASQRQSRAGVWLIAIGLSSVLGCFHAILLICHHDKVWASEIWRKWSTRLASWEGSGLAIRESEALRQAAEDAAVLGGETASNKSPPRL